MKQAFIFILLIIVAANSFSQDSTANVPATKTDYLKKSKGQKTAAWIMLGAGVAMFAIAAPGDVSFDAAGVLVVAGSALVLGSIPLFIAASKNKKKAKAASAFFKMETSPVIHHSSIANKTYPVVSIRISL